MAKIKTLGPGTVVVASTSQVSSEVGSEVVILDLDGGVYHGLNATGARIWSLITQPRSIAEICGEMLRVYDVEPAQCERDVYSIVEALAAKGLVELRPAA